MPRTGSATPTRPGAALRQPEVLGILNGAAAGAFWGSIFVIPLLLPGFNAWQLSAARYLVYGGVALLLMAPRLRSLLTRVGRREWLALFGLGMLGNIAYYVLLVWGVQWAGAAPTALIIGLIPVAVTVVGSRRSGALPLRALAAPLALCFVGVALVAVHGLAHGTAATAELPLWQRGMGLLAACGALLSWSAYSVWNSHWLLRRPDLSPWDWSLLTGLTTGILALTLAIPAFGAPLLAMLTDAAGTAPQHSGTEWLRFWAITGTLAILASVVGNAFWNRASRLLPLTMIGQMIVFETVFALLYGFLYEWRLPSLVEMLAISALLGGILWCANIHRPRSTA
ncbi:multidrug DMT transporter permease [Lampropedia cohaerens]|uniref:Multidrug DMT transporter permease n=1 Tax=Lampropedia cohaerens TaxID=1610491 RepID=A0A0U1PYP4_9BURK|nr:DMT family transporter [Lampropedia cohaerens]KKW67587.1 multidrug DMT transporter permease [Lampropedia cohaerens]